MVEGEAESGFSRPVFKNQTSSLVYSLVGTILRLAPDHAASYRHHAGIIPTCIIENLVFSIMLAGSSQRTANQNYAVKVDGKRVIPDIPGAVWLARAKKIMSVDFIFLLYIAMHHSTVK